MTEIEDLLRELVAETRAQTVHLEDMKRCMEHTCSSEDMRRAEQMMMKSAQDRKDEHRALEKAVEKHAANGNITYYQKLIIWLIIALFAAFGLTKAAEYVAGG